MAKKIRLQKYCSEQGIASRRKTEEYIKNGWIAVNGQVVQEVGLKIDPDNDKVELLPGAKEEQKDFIYCILNKPKGFVTNLPQEGEKEAKELLPKNISDKVHAVGRLDKDSLGLLFFTNNGVVAHRLTSPAFNHDKEYEVVVDRTIEDEVLEKFEQGLTLDGEELKPVKILKINARQYLFILREGKKRQIRNMLQEFDYKVFGLKRIRIANIKLESLQLGKHRFLSEKELSDLLGLLKLEMST